ncbi:MAG: hypothetical protein IPI93_06120 [Sphingobacteriaceae bacterium]|nr:hypothetical protein [Sphingobacteriaceae bacterium]MBK7816341.1 hypothetical protein [Sphingobacteriaceae bacterium]
MFKGKKGLYILIPLNILIWGYFAFRFYSFYNPDDEPRINDSSTSAKIEDIKDSVNYKLQLSYEDPFLKSEPKEKNNHSSKSLNKEPVKAKVEKVKNLKQEPEKTIPVIKYMGLVKNNSNGLATAIVSINGSSKLVKQDETVDGLRFKDFNNENLTVFWNKEKIVITK